MTVTLFLLLSKENSLLLFNKIFKDFQKTHYFYKFEEFNDYINDELSKIEYSTKNITDLENKIKDTEKDLYKMAVQIRELRQNYAQVLSVLIQDKLEFLELTADLYGETFKLFTFD